MGETKLAIRAREATGLSQSNFAATYGININTLRAWEQEGREPSGAARMYLLLILQYPTTMDKLVRAVRRE